jgi:2-polyprenyl-6-methoxyphenol hydroxylase-like FAD-dependent oxidoreductase
MSPGTAAGGENFDVAYLVLSGTTTAARCPELLHALVGLGFSTVVAIPTRNAAAADQAGTTIAVIHDGRQPRPQIERAIRGTFGIAQGAPLIYLGRHPAFPQSAAAPLRGRVIAIGDAAFSHDPIGGRGLSFALGCAFAAGAVLQTWRDQPARRREAIAYYEDFARAEQRRHLAFLSGHQEPARQSLPAQVIWSAKKARAPLALMKGGRTCRSRIDGNRGPSALAGAF